MEPGFEPLDGIGLFVWLPAVVMVDSLARAGRDLDALAFIARVLDKTSDPQRSSLSFGASAASWSHASPNGLGVPQTCCTFLRALANAKDCRWAAKQLGRTNSGATHVQLHHAEVISGKRATPNPTI